MKQTTILAIVAVLCITTVARAAKTNSPTVKRIDFADLMQQSSGPGTHYVYEKGHEDTPFTGIAARTYKDGRKTETHFKNGKGNGLSILWHANGKKAMQVTLLDGKPHGEMITWNAKGEETSRKNYLKGKEQQPNKTPEHISEGRKRPSKNAQR
jgi:hypothetical protein